MKTTADAFGTLVEVGDTVVFKGTPKYLEKGEVVKCTPKGATVRCGIRKVNVRSERIYLVNKGQQSLFVADGGFVTERKVIDMTHEDYISPFPSQQPVMCQ